MTTPGGIVKLLNVAAWIFKWFLKRIDARNAPREKSKKAIQKMDKAIVDGDGDRVGDEFRKLFDDADRHDPGQHETNKDK